jgi:hypothetical protein
MLVSSQLNTSSQESASSSVTPAASQAYAQPPQASSTEAAPSSTPPVVDTYTTSQRGGGSTPQYSVTINSAPSDASAGVLAALSSNYLSPTQQAWLNLTQSMAAGDLASAQTALNDYTQSLPASTAYMSSLTTPSAQFRSDLTALGSALNAGNLADAQTAFRAAEVTQPDNVAGAMGSALDTVINNMEAIAQGGGSPSASSAAQLTQDISTLDGVLAESSANVDAMLIAAGYTPSEASGYTNNVANFNIDVSASGANVSVNTAVDTYALGSSGDSSSATDSSSASSASQGTTAPAPSAPAGPSSSAASSASAATETASSFAESMLAIENTVWSATSVSGGSGTQTVVQSTAQEAYTTTFTDPSPTNESSNPAPSGNGTPGGGSLTLIFSESSTTTVAFTVAVGSSGSSAASAGSQTEVQVAALFENSEEIRSFGRMMDAIDPSGGNADPARGAGVNLTA